MSVVVNNIVSRHSLACENSIKFNTSATSSTFDKIGEQISLRELKVGERAHVVHVQACGDLGRRIRDMGLVPGTEIMVIGKAPLKDPVALKLLGFTLSLRNNEADYIIVTPIHN